MFEGTNILNDVIDSDRQALLASLKSGKISHAYLFVGDDKVAAENSCKEFVSAIFSGNGAVYKSISDRIEKGTHADVVDVYPEGTGIKLDRLRNVVGFLQTSPTESDYKMIIIHDAHTMRDDSQNFLLKTIEEPPANTVMVLIAQSKDNILGTILSRVTTVTVKSKGIDLKNQDIRRFVANRMEKLILEGSIEGIFSTAKAFLQSAEDKNISRKDAALMNLEYVHSFFVQMLTYKQTNITKDYTKDDFGILYTKIGKVCNTNIINTVQKTITAIERNASPQLAVEAMLIDILEECNAENSWNQI
ncbi:MAG: hypothetical protein E7218_00425 [Anaerofustis stercorihominis]|nr:hypothetical protein [Anaerofustis stercorihominis]